MAKAATTGRKKQRDPDSHKAILTRVNHNGWRVLRMLAAEQDTKLNALAIEAFNDLLAKYGKRRAVENPLLEGNIQR